jgi:GTP-binding protein
VRFIDEVKIRVTSGTGGKGCTAFRREKFVPFGGPSGGNGGKGGDVVFLATQRRNTLLELRGKSAWRAGKGTGGGGSQKTGATGDDLHVMVPVGTRVFDADTDEVVADLTHDGDTWVAATGGRGGFGNLHFKTSTNRAPTKSTPGGESEDRHFRLELMLMADVGLLGFPNAGKSTLVSRVSAAKPRVADYPFTTLVPSLGVVDLGIEGSFTVADIPGLIEGASEGTGLGHQFLRHLSRTRVIVHLISAAEHDEGVVTSGDIEIEDALRRYQALRHELAVFDARLARRREIVVLTKTDAVLEERILALKKAFEIAIDGPVLTISAATGRGLDTLIHHIRERIQDTEEE